MINLYFILQILGILGIHEFVITGCSNSGRSGAPDRPILQEGHVERVLAIALRAARANRGAPGGAPRFRERVKHGCGVDAVSA